jgi:hypothetical protein
MISQLSASLPGVPDNVSPFHESHGGSHGEVNVTGVFDLAF